MIKNFLIFTYFIDAKVWNIYQMPKKIDIYFQLVEIQSLFFDKIFRLNDYYYSTFASHFYRAESQS